MDIFELITLKDVEEVSSHDENEIEQKLFGRAIFPKAKYHQRTSFSSFDNSSWVLSFVFQ